MTNALKKSALLRSVTSQVGARLLLSLGRLGVALLISRLAGKDTFGEYALLLSILTLFEWLVDFGQTDISVRDACQSPQDEAKLL